MGELKMKRVGEAGQLGTKFEAELLFELPEGPIVVKPSIEISKGDVHRNPAMINDQYYVNVFSMDAGTKAVNIQVGFMRPVYPIELFYKPLTSFVWLGTALMTLGGLMSSFNRRNRKPSNTQENQTGTKSVEEHEDALVPAP